MSKVLNVTVVEQQDCEDVINCQEIREDLSNVDKLRFSVFNLCDCPEDAIIGRDLFNAYDYIDALNKGIMLAKLGYDKVEGKSVVVYEDDEEE